MFKIIHKPWGKEEWLALNEFYCYKRIYINAGYKTSYQYHEFKYETNYIIEGTAEVWLENDEGVVEKKIMCAGDFFDVSPPKKHRIIALTDIILQEVSTPHVDDVFRINDEFNRGNGKVDSEHKTPAVLILAAGIGSRLGNLTKNINKSMIPINNKAIISHIIDKFSKDYEFVIALGYKGDILKEYCQMVYPNHKFIFVEVDNIDGENSGPGYSALKCKQHLQRPFYFITADCIVDSKIPHLDGNWLGTYPTSYPEKYSTVKIDTQDNILSFVNKNKNGFENAFIGLASIWDYEVFWNELDSNIENGEIVCAFQNLLAYSSFKSKYLNWLDTGNLDDLNKTKQHLNDKPLSLYKETNEISYKENKFIKFITDEVSIKNITKRAEILNNLIPSGFQNKKHFISYDWEEGLTLYNYDSFSLYVEFLEFLNKKICDSNKYKTSSEIIDNFYLVKTSQRKQMFLIKFGDRYLTTDFIINDKEYKSINNLLNKFDITKLYDNTMYSNFHGDLQFDNIIYNEKTKNFKYIDWRESFAGDTFGGDIYYDLSKLYGGCLIPYNLVKNDDFLKINEGSTIVNYDFTIPNSLKEFKTEYEKWIFKNGYDFNKIKLITSLIFLNMSPLHSEKFGKILWFKSIELLSNAN